MNRDTIIRRLDQFRTFVSALSLLFLVIFFSIAVVTSPDLLQVVSDLGAQLQPAVGFKEIKNLSYADGATDLKGDLYLPQKVIGNIPAIVIVHGGSWNSGDKADLNEAASCRWLGAHGYAAFSINYRLVGHGGEFPNDIRDVKQAVFFLASNSSKWNLDKNRLFLLGSSSGATAALLAAYGMDLEQAGIAACPVVAVASISGPTEMDKVHKNPYLQKYLHEPKSEKETLDLCKILSPIQYVRSAIPTICVHGSEDKNVSNEHPANLCKLLQVRGIACQLVTVEGSGHFIGGVSRNLALERIVAFFNQAATHRSSALSVDPEPAKTLVKTPPSPGTP